jgi:tetraacyldisaccharide 4'-kinase
MNPLSPIGWLYGLGADARNALYDRGIYKTHSLGARTISVGNLTTGGTGKTPMVALVARLLADQGEKVCILTRGYGRKNPGNSVLVSDGSSVRSDARHGGDEPVELAFKLIGKAAVIADGDRIAAAKRAIAELGSTAFVLDDAFQHRRAERDIDIVCIDSTNPWGNGEILPAGTLREGVANITRANAVVITRTDLVKDVTQIETEIRRMHPEVSLFRSSNNISRIVELQQLLDKERVGSNVPMDLVGSAFAFCGLGNPANFFRQLEMKGIHLAGRKTFPDHYFYKKDDIAEIERKARSSGADNLITTVKDAVRLTEAKFSLPCYVGEIETVMSDATSFRDLIFS